jgi:hypothetical protein
MKTGTERPEINCEVSSIRVRLARGSYWLLFILAPVATLLLCRGIRTTTFYLAFLLFVLLVLVGEHAFRPWRRLWRIPVGPLQSPQNHPPRIASNDSNRNT